ncbi:hypothetical protein [Paenibacillus senegalensis]|uniref:hypothetical protein n=1 Tax=Paenibacillus senegalensis TaxID=1465766 RepID=UPI0012FC4344|nr:hypothetical protein [Paenibacillus senegalensis]
MKIKLYSETSKRWLCFRHAVARSLTGEDIELETDEDDFTSEFDMRDTGCADCRLEDF